MKEKLIDGLKDALEIEDRDIQLDDVFRDYDEWDSLGRLSLIAMLDDSFGVQIEDQEFEKLDTVGDILNAIEKKAES